jgi:hypothetical protein
VLLIVCKEGLDLNLLAGGFKSVYAFEGIKFNPVVLFTGNAFSFSLYPFVK